MSCVFQPLLILWRGFHRDSDRHRQARDSSRGRAAHLFLNRCRRSAEVDIQASCKDAHGGQHAGAERRGCKVRRREALSPALVVDWRVSSQFGLRRRMHRGTVEVALVLRLNENHIASIFALKLQKDEPRGRRRQPQLRRRRPLMIQCAQPSGYSAALQRSRLLKQGRVLVPERLLHDGDHSALFWHLEAPCSWPSSLSAWLRAIDFQDVLR